MPVNLIARRSPLGQQRKSATATKMSAFGGKADEIRAKADFGARMSEAEGRPDVARRWSELLFLARTGSSASSPPVHASGLSVLFEFVDICRAIRLNKCKAFHM